MKKHIIFALFLCIQSMVFANSATTNHGKVRWNATIDYASDETGLILLSAEIDEGCHVYSFAPDGGQNPLEINIASSQGVYLGEIEYSVPPQKEYSPTFGKELSSWNEDVKFSIPFSLSKDVDGAVFEVKIRYQYCLGKQCYTPKKETFNLSVGNTEGLSVINDSIKSRVEKNDSFSATNPLWEPVDVKSPVEDSSPWSILILGFFGGLAALLTPCVWPMIPMTLSFFLKKGKATAKSKRDALTYGLSIIIIYLVLGLAVTLIFGAGELNALSTSAVFNIIFFLLLVVFAISFFGAFDIKLPSKWSTAIDSKAENTSGMLSIFFMAFTLALVSFSCTGPIIGTLLVEAASNGSIVGPALGMGGFALGLALPFSLFALFPSMLKEMPKSGGWLNTVKVVLGFIELILSLKFLSVADMAYGWHILDRETFLALWIVLFVLLGFYLLGKIRFSHDGEQHHVGIFRFFLALFSFSFAVYLLPGLWGAPLKSVSAFVPPLETLDFNLYTHEVNYVEYDDYDEGLEIAAKEGKPVLVDFSGWGCVNCRNMEAEVFDSEKVRTLLSQDFVVVKLMVDDRTHLRTPFVVEDNGATLEIETVGEKWSYLQSHKFGANSQPYYIVLDNQGRPLTTPCYYDNNVQRFIQWLEEGLLNYKR